jgi:hypothetical protein
MGRASRIATIGAMLGSVLSIAVEARQGATPDRDLYLNACAACHGADGRGRPKSVVGFDTPLPDLTECSFATPEADADWLAVAHSGGPIRAFDRRMPAFGEALSQTSFLGSSGTSGRSAVIRRGRVAS